MIKCFKKTLLQKGIKAKDIEGHEKVKEEKKETKSGMVLDTSSEDVEREVYPMLRESSLGQDQEGK